MRSLNSGKKKSEERSNGKIVPSGKDLEDFVRIITDASLDPDLIIILPNGTKLPIKPLVDSTNGQKDQKHEP